MLQTPVHFRLAELRGNRVVLAPVNLPCSVASLSRERKAAELQKIVAEEARLAARKVEVVLALAEDSRADSSDGEISEFFVDELALVLNCSRAAASALYRQARTLEDRLPATFAELKAGRLDWPRTRAIADELGEPADDTDPAVITGVEAVVLPQAAGLSIRRLKEQIRFELLARDAEAADRRRKLARRAVNVAVRGTGDGMGELVSGHRLDRAVAMRDAIDQYAWMRRREGDERPINVIRSEVHEDLILRAWQNHPAVTARLGLAAPLGALRPNVPVPGAAGTHRDRQRDADHRRAPAPARQRAQRRPPVRTRGRGAAPGAAGRERQAARHPHPGELAQLAKKGCPEHPGAGADVLGGCGCPVLDAPPPIDRYQPTPAQRRFVSTRDRTCRWPGCSNRAAWADHDHVIPHADGGDTDCCHLCCLCRRRHGIKTRDRNWRFVMDEDGTLHVTTPSGVTRTTRPPGLDPASEPPADPADDPPPF